MPKAAGKARWGVRPGKPSDTFVEAARKQALKACREAMASTLDEERPIL